MEEENNLEQWAFLCISDRYSDYRGPLINMSPAYLLLPSMVMKLGPSLFSSIPSRMV